MKTYEDLTSDGGSNIMDQVVYQREKLRARLDKIKHKISLMSGKGGVGKSSLTANIAACLVSRGHTVGILDADLNGQEQQDREQHAKTAQHDRLQNPRERLHCRLPLCHHRARPHGPWKQRASASARWQ